MRSAARLVRCRPRQSPMHRARGGGPGRGWRSVRWARGSRSPRRRRRPTRRGGREGRGGRAAACPRTCGARRRRLAERGRGPGRRCRRRPPLFNARCRHTPAGGAASTRQFAAAARTKRHPPALLAPLASLLFSRRPSLSASPLPLPETLKL